jgi:hypothetical protein
MKNYLLLGTAMLFTFAVAAEYDYKPYILLSNSKHQTQILNQTLKKDAMALAGLLTVTVTKRLVRAVASARINLPLWRQNIMSTI